MDEQEKLERAIRVLEGHYKNSVLRHNGELLTVNELISLLKAQEPVLVKPYTEVEYGFKPKVKVGKCPNCGRIVNEQCNYCSKCGRPVKWE